MVNCCYDDYISVMKELAKSEESGGGGNLNGGSCVGIYKRNAQTVGREKGDANFPSHSPSHALYLIFLFIS